MDDAAVRPGIEHRNGRVVGEQMVGSEHVFPQAIVQCLEPPAGAADPAREGRELQRPGGLIARAV